MFLFYSNTKYLSQLSYSDLQLSGYDIKAGLWWHIITFATVEVSAVFLKIYARPLYHYKLMDINNIEVFSEGTDMSKK